MHHHLILIGKSHSRRDHSKTLNQAQTAKSNLIESNIFSGMPNIFEMFVIISNSLGCKDPSASAILNGEVRSKGIEIDEGATIEAKFTKEQELNG